MMVRDLIHCSRVPEEFLSEDIKAAHYPLINPIQTMEIEFHLP